MAAGSTPAVDQAARKDTHTGFRAAALASQTPESFDLGNAPTVTLPARRSKNRKTKVQPLPAD
jgi:hypothetical protein